MKTNILFLFAFQSNGPHVTMYWGHYGFPFRLCNDPHVVRTVSHIQLHLENRKKKQNVRIDKAFKHSEGVF